MGSIIGGLYAIGYDGQRLERIARDIDWLSLFTDKPSRGQTPFLVKKYDGKHQIRLGLDGFTPTIPVAYIEGQNVSLLLSRLTQEYNIVKDFDQLPIPFRCVAADLSTGQEVVLSRGSLSRAMRASMSIPTIFKPVEWGDTLLVDGKIVNNFPANVLKEMGMDIIVGVDVGAPLKGRDQIRNVMDILNQTISLVGLERIEQNKKLVDILISPNMRNFSATDFEPDRIALLLNEGKRAARANLNQLTQLAKQLQRYEADAPASVTSSTQDTNKIIHRIEVIGNQQLSFSFIYNQIGLSPGDEFDDVELETRITNLYALGYFETIEYEIFARDDKSIILRIIVVERTKRDLGLGLRYDDYFKLVGLISFFGTDIIIPGLRLESDLQFAGLTTFSIKPSFPSRSLNLPVFPFFKYYFWDIPTAIYDSDGIQFARYDNRGNAFSFGLDVLIGRNIAIESGYKFEYLNFKPDIALAGFPRFQNDVREISVITTVDKLDDVLIPRNGLFLTAEYNYSNKNIGSQLNYNRIAISAKWYTTIFKRHTFMFYGFYGNSQTLPTAKYFFHGGPDTFVGLSYMQLAANRVDVLRIDYRYEFKKDIFVKLMANTAFDYRSSEIGASTDKVIFGYGISMVLQSIAGPFEIIYSRGDKSPENPGDKTYHIYFKAGYHF
jgi:NTE family protein